MADWRDYMAQSEAIDTDTVRITYSISVAADVDARQAATQIARITSERQPQRLESRNPEQGGPSVTHVSRQGLWTEVCIAIPGTYWVPEDGIPSLLEMITSPVEYDFCQGLWISNIDLPRRYVRELRGPTLGVDGLRTLTARASGPLLGIEVGVTRPDLLKSLAPMLTSALTGGIDILVQDMRMPWFRDNSARQQISDQLVAIRDRSAQETGRRKLALITVSGSPVAMFNQIERFIHQDGGDGIVMNAIHCGFGLLQDIRDHYPEIVVINTNMGSGLWSRPPTYAADSLNRAGMDELVVTKLSRLCGADAVHAGTTGSECYDAEWSESIQALAARVVVNEPGEDEKLLAPSFRVAEGGLNQLALWKNIRLLGNDTVFEIPAYEFTNAPDPKDVARSWRASADAISSVADPQTAILTYKDLAKTHRPLRDELNKSRVEDWCN